jgi:hypothetical protein
MMLDLRSDGFGKTLVNQLDARECARRLTAPAQKRYLAPAAVGAIIAPFASQTKERGAYGARKTTWLRGGLYVGRLLALGALRHFKGNLLAFLERFEATHLDGREMGEQVFAAVIRLDKPVTLRIVKPLYRTSWHVSPPTPQTLEK